ncbi:hypothetical protein HPB47_001255 [Ixodes persulcatus]|uniref:Uncharacterized protein n=1 Tax=Ixodes persulcatus TaxID=34615 RepID=A0AC60PPN6_IXOPE|nr:hypothetical protein HPB47_001255 [Ixodes persulcatus]
MGRNAAKNRRISPGGFCSAQYPEQNIFVIYTSNSGRAEAYSKMQAINFAGKTYPATAYITTSENTCKGIIHGIPEEDTPETIWDSLQYNTNPPILQFRRLGKSGPLLLLYEGQRVPHWVDYRGGTLRCLFYKKRGEVCKICARVGHREDICPTPDDKQCLTCGTVVSDNANHECTPLCVICGGGHESGSKRCRQRFLPARKPRAPSSRPWISRTKLLSPPWTLRRAATAPPDPGIDRQAPAGSSTAPAPTPDPDHVLVPGEEAGAPAGGPDVTRKSSTSATSKADARSEEELEGILQQGIDLVSGAVKTFGLACSPEKSEYMIVRPSGLRRSTTKPPLYRMELLLEGETLPTRDYIRILGMTFHSNGHNTEQIRKVELATQQTSRLIRRIANRHSGMGEADLLRLIQAFVISRAMTMVAIDGHGVPLFGGSIPTTNSETAEEVAIAIALLVANTQTMISDSKRAILIFARGRVSEATLRVLTRTSKIPNDMVSLIWAPAHTTLPGNEAAHTTTRELAYRTQGAMAGTGNEPKEICDGAEEAATVWGRLRTDTTQERPSNYGLAPKTGVSLCPKSQGGLTHLKKGLGSASPQRRNSRPLQEVYTLPPVVNKGDASSSAYWQPSMKLRGACWCTLVLSHRVSSEEANQDSGRLVNANYSGGQRSRRRGRRWAAILHADYIPFTPKLRLRW